MVVCPCKLHIKFIPFYFSWATEKPSLHPVKKALTLNVASFMLQVFVVNLSCLLFFRVTTINTINTAHISLELYLTDIVLCA